MLSVNNAELCIGFMGFLVVWFWFFFCFFGFDFSSSSEIYLVRSLSVFEIIGFFILYEKNNAFQSY